MSLFLVVLSAVATYSFVSARLTPLASAQLPAAGSAAAAPEPAAAAPDGAQVASEAGQSVRQAFYMRQNLDALAEKLGRMQARLTRLDTLGERISAMAGIDPKPSAKPGKLAGAVPGRGGPLLPDRGVLTLDELNSAISEVSESLERRSEHLNLVESEFLFQKAASKLVPSNKPLEGGFMASRFGRRIDPITGRAARHDGLDFGAPTGTPILAAGAGVVVFAARHPAYGWEVDIDHGSGLLTRYAHASKLVVKAGDIVRQGQKIAEVGSTGRSTGPHLHFEVRQNDTPQDPMHYLGKPMAFQPAGAERTASR